MPVYLLFFLVYVGKERKSRWGGTGFLERERVNGMMEKDGFWRRNDNQTWDWEERLDFVGWIHSRVTSFFDILPTRSNIIPFFYFLFFAKKCRRTCEDESPPHQGKVAGCWDNQGRWKTKSLTMDFWFFSFHLLLLLATVNQETGKRKKNYYIIGVEIA